MKEGEGEIRRDGLDGWFASPEDRLPVVPWSYRRHEGRPLRERRGEAVLGSACVEYSMVRMCNSLELSDGMNSKCELTMFGKEVILLIDVY